MSFEIPNNSADTIRVVNSVAHPRDDHSLLDESRIKKVDFSEALREGRFSAKVDGVTFECLLKRSDERKLYVFLSGGRWRDGELAAYPSFPRWNYYKMIKGNVLFIDDPMYSNNSNLVTGWFYGTEKKNYREIASKLIINVAKNLEVSTADIVIFSSLANTSASIHVGSYIPGCTVLAVNPTIDLTASKESFGFKKETGIDLKARDRFHRNSLYDAITDSASTYLLACNIRSVEDYEEQVIPLFNLFDVTPKFGLNRISDNIFVWTYDAQATGSSAHNSADFYELFPVIDFVVSNLKGMDYQELQKFVDSIGNPTWFNMSVLKKKIYDLRS